MIRQSVILPVFNGERHIRAALDSALPQLGPDDEIIVVDNNCTDRSMEIVRDVGDPRIRIVTETVKGPAAARNAGLAAVTGDLVSFLDHDDLWPAGRNAALLDALECHPQIQAVYGRLRVAFELGPEPAFMAMDGALSNKLHLSVFLFRASSILETGPFDVTKPSGSDIEFLLRYEGAGWPSMAWDGDALIYRRHETNLTRDAALKRFGMISTLAAHLQRKRGMT